MNILWWFLFCKEDVTLLHGALKKFKKNFFFVIKTSARNLKSKKVAIWQYFSISGKHRHTLFLIFVFCPFQIKNYIITGLVSNFFNAPCNRVTSSLQNRNHHKIFNNWLYDYSAGCSALFLFLKMPTQTVNFDAGFNLLESFPSNMSIINAFLKWGILMSRLAYESNIFCMVWVWCQHRIHTHCNLCTFKLIVVSTHESEYIVKFQYWWLKYI